MPRKKKFCPVCGQGRCTKSEKCVEFRAHGTIEGRPTTIYTYDAKGRSTEHRGGG